MGVSTTCKTITKSLPTFPRHVRHTESHVSTNFILVLARSSRFRPMSPAGQVGLEAYRFESCRERYFFLFTNLIKYLHFVRRTLSTLGIQKDN